MSGISLAQRLNEHADVIVFEQHSEIGGLINCERVDGILYHKVGGHVFNSKNPQVIEWFWNFFDKEAEFIKAKRNAKVFFNQKLIGYPIEDHLFQLDEDLTRSAINELLSTGETKTENFEAFLRSTFGQTLYNIYFKPYNKKIWNVDLQEVPLGWLEGKLPMPKLKDIIINNILRKEETEMVHAFFYYPKVGGSQFIIDRLAQNIVVNKTSPVERITIKQDGSLYINDIGPFDQVVYTGDIRKLPNYLESSISLSEEEKVKAFKSNGTTNILCRCDQSNLSWLYIPEEQYKAHRIIYTGNFSPTNNDASGRSSCTVEFSNYIDVEEAKAELQKLPGNLEFISYNYEPNSYVIQDEDTREIVERTKSELKKHKIYLLGRFAEWEYYNMDKAIEAAMSLEKELLLKVS